MNRIRQIFRPTPYTPKTLQTFNQELHALYIRPDLAAKAFPKGGDLALDKGSVHVLPHKKGWFNRRHHRDAYRWVEKLLDTPQSRELHGQDTVDQALAQWRGLRQRSGTVSPADMYLALQPVSFAAQCHTATTTATRVFQAAYALDARRCGAPADPATGPRGRREALAAAQAWGAAYHEAWHCVATEPAFQAVRKAAQEAFDGVFEQHVLAEDQCITLDQLAENLLTEPLRRIEASAARLKALGEPGASEALDGERARQAQALMDGIERYIQRLALVGKYLIDTLAPLFPGWMGDAVRQFGIGLVRLSECELNARSPLMRQYQRAQGSGRLHLESGGLFEA